jgi:hypothetical protein
MLDFGGLHLKIRVIIMQLNSLESGKENAAIGVLQQCSEA